MLSMVNKVKKGICLNNSKTNVLLVLGDPGTGKTTQCRLLAKNLNFDYFTIGELIYGSKHSQSLNKLREGLNINNSKSNDEIENMFKTMLRKSHKEKIIIEGFAATKNDLFSWKLLIDTNIHIIGALYLHCPEEIMKWRLFNREKDRIDNIDEIAEAMNYYSYEDKLLVNLETLERVMYIETDDSIHNTFQAIKTELRNHYIISNKTDQNEQTKEYERELFQTFAS